MKIGRSEFIWATSLMLSAAALQASPATAAAPKPPPDRAPRLFVVYGDDPCPNDNGDEIVVCARKPESERYRIPKDLRHKGEDLTEKSWASNVASLDDAARETRPNSCSVVGSGGQSGCFQQMMWQWLSERNAAKRQQSVP